MSEHRPVDTTLAAEPTPPPDPGPPARGLVANSWLVARREFRERVRSRLFLVSTVLLATLAVSVALSERDGSPPILMADTVLGALAAGDYLIELRVRSAEGLRTTMIAFRVVP